MALARSVSVKLRAEVAEYVAGLGKAAGATKEFKTELNEAAKKGNLDGVVTAATGAGLALSGMAGYAVYAGMQFDKQMSGVKAATHASASEMESLRQAALDAGAATVFSATDAAKAQTELAKAGLTTSQILGGGLRGALSLAAAGEMDVGEAAETAATAMSQFGLSGRDIPHVADLLAAGAGKAQGEVADMGMALKQSGLVANQFGVSIEETTGTLAAFASAGLIGSDAGTSFKTMLLQLAKPSKESAATMRELGINAYDATGKFVGIRDLAEQLKTKMSGLTQAQRDSALATIFGTDAIRAANVLYKEGATGIGDWTDKVNATGFAIDTAAEKTDNLAGDMERLKGSFETLAIQAGSGVSGGLRTLTQLADGMLGAFAALPEPVTSAATVIAGLGGAALTGTAGLLKIKEVLNDALEALSGMGPTGERASRGLGRVADGMGKVAAGAAAAEASILLVGVAWRAFADNHPELSAEKLATALEKVAAGEGLDVLGKSVKEFDLDLQTLSNNTMDNFSHRWSAFVEGISGTGDLDGTFTKARADIEKLDAVLGAMVNDGNADSAAAAFARITAEAQKQGISVDELKAGFPQYAAALDGAAVAADEHAQAEASAAEKVDTMAGSLGEAVKKAGSLKDAFDLLNGTLMGWAEAEIAAEAAVDKLGESLAKNGLTWDVNTEKGRANKEELLTGIQAARDAAQAKLDESHSIEQANGVYELYKGKLVQTMIQSGMTKDAAWALVNQFGQMPPLVATQVTAPGLDSARERASGFRSIMEALDGKVVKTQVINEIITRRIDQGNVVPGSGGRRIMRFGGVHYAAQGLINLDGVAAAFPAGNETLYGFREKGTRGEAFIARNAPDAASLHYADVAAQWHGGRVVTDAVLAQLAGGQGGSSAGAIAEALAARLGPMLAGLADRPAIFEIDNQRIAQAVRQGDRGLARRG